MLDYKDVSFSFRDRKIHRRRRLLKWCLVVLLAMAAGIGYRCLRARAAVGGIQELLLAGRLDEADRRLQAAGSPFFQRGNFRELTALSELCRGRLDAAAGRLEKLRRDKTATSLRSEDMLEHFFDRGEYRKLKIYTDYLLPRGKDEARWFQALYLAAFLDPGGSEKAASGLSAPFRGSNGKALGLLSQFNRTLRARRINYVFDRNDLPLAYFDLQHRTTRWLVPGLEFSDFDARFREGARRFRLALDGELQKKVDRLFSGFFGTLVLLELPENSIVAAYSKPRAAAAANTAFTEPFEPGSIAKVISLLAYLHHGETGIFPLKCTGQLQVGGGIISDLSPHGQVRDVSRALALSCNVGFARMGLAVGFAGLSDMLRRFFFNSPLPADPFCRFATGRFNQAAGSDFALARLAAGIDGISLTTLHAAVLAAIISQDGQLFPPYLVDDVKNILGLGFYRHAARPQRVLADDLNFLRVKKAMAAVVEDEEGTGHRARHETMRLAIKTGTAGRSPGGLDAVIIGFFPLERPRYAFAFRLEGAGRAEFNGTLFLQGLLRALYPD